ncbi:MAG: DinB family protein [Gemmatimonadales bacterium]
MAGDPRIALLLRVLDQAFDRRAWHGTGLWGSLRGLGYREALRRPARGRHNIWEIALHTAYWKYIVRRRLTRDESLAFPRAGSDWPPLPARPGPRPWKADVALLRAEHRLLRHAIARFPASRLGARGWRSQWTNEQHIYGIASHDLYHAGQIQLLKRLMR